MKLISIIFITSLIAVIIIFATLNVHTVAINYYYGSTQLFLSLLLVMVFSGSVMMTLLGSLPMILTLLRKNGLLKKQLNINIEEIRNLRRLPLKDKT